ncbi:MAG: WSD1 family O-acyltransferase [Desulfobacterales bacterium]|nr:WSD1 family O-acyltransferase [Desulfobacterales bacterium]
MPLGARRIRCSASPRCTTRCATLKGSHAAAHCTLTALGLLGMLPDVGAGPRRRTVQPQGDRSWPRTCPDRRRRCTCAGSASREMYFWVPQSGSIGVGVSILSYAGQVSLRDDFRPPGARRAGPRGRAVRRTEFEKLLLAATVGALASRPRCALRQVPSPRIDTVQQTSADSATIVDTSSRGTRREGASMAARKKTRKVEPNGPQGARQEADATQAQR